MKKKLALAAVALLVILAVTYVVLPKKTNKNTGATTSTITKANPNAKQTAETKAKDQKVLDGLHGMLTNIINYYTINSRSYPLANSDGWAQIMNEVYTDNSFVSPYTNLFYTFAASSGDPGFGQVQYGPGKTCNNNSFATGNFRSMALRTLTLTSVRCVSIDPQNASSQ